MTRKKSLQQENGYILITVLLAMGVIALLSTAVLGYANTSLRIARKAVESEQAFYMANAGMERVMAQVNAGQTITSAPLTGTIQITPGLAGSYSVALTVSGKDVSITSTGVVGGSTRQITAHANRPLPEGYGAKIVSATSLALDNNSVVCGDIFVNGDLDLGAQTHIWGRVKPDGGSPCDSVLGTGKVIATGRISINGNYGTDQDAKITAAIDGGWCDVDTFGPETPCKGAKPQAAPITPTDLNAIKAQATELWVKTQADCGTRVDICHLLTPDVDKKGTPTGTYTYTLADTPNKPLPHFNNAVIYIDGNLLVPPDPDATHNAATLDGTVTFAVKGHITFQGNTVMNASCTPDTCAAAFVSDGYQYLNTDMNNQKTTKIYGVFITNDVSTATLSGFTWDNGAEIHGNVVAQKLIAGHHALYYPTVNSLQVFAPALPTPTDTLSGFDGWTEP